MEVKKLGKKFPDVSITLNAREVMMLRAIVGNIGGTGSEFSEFTRQLYNRLEAAYPPGLYEFDPYASTPYFDIHTATEYLDQVKE